MKKNKLLEKIVKYKKDLVHYYVSTKNNFIFLIDKTKTVRLSQLTEKEHDPTVKTAVIGWVLDILQYGIILSIPYFTLKNNINLLLPISLGIMHWFAFDVLREIINIIKR